MMILRGPRIESLRFAGSLAAGVDLSKINATLEQPLEIILGYPLLAQADGIIDLSDNRGRQYCDRELSPLEGFSVSRLKGPLYRSEHT